MKNKHNMHGGGANTNVTGLKFERDTDLKSTLENIGYIVEDDGEVKKEGKTYGFLVPKHKFYVFLNHQGVNYQDYNSIKWLPDEAFINQRNKTLYIIEKKMQTQGGSVDEKLANCEFKKMEYQKLATPIGLHVKYIYIFSEWYKQPKYKDVLAYIRLKDCSYYYNEIPIQELGLDI